MAIVSMNVSVNGAGTVPLGAIIAIGNVAGWTLPATGQIKDGYAICDGQSFPTGSNTLFTGTMPNLTDNRFLNGTTVAVGPGGVGGANSKTLTTAELPSHSHANTLTDATVASSSHVHDMTHIHQTLHRRDDGLFLEAPEQALLIQHGQQPELLL